MRAAVFPGQGSQKVGMGRELAEAFPEARAVFAEIDDALGEPLSETIWNGPEDALQLTMNAQPALMAVSIAAMRALETKDAPLTRFASCAAGHSLGEYSALVATGALELRDAARLLRLRGKSMQEAAPVGSGAMAALIGLDFEAAAAVAAEAAESDVCEAANDNAPGQVVISGSKAAVERALLIAKEKGAKRAMPLPVSAPFHSALMQPAAEAMQAALADTKISAPSVPIYANFTAAPTSEPEEIRTLLVSQITGRVRWRESVGAMAESGVSELIEIGAGKVLTGMAKRIDARLTGRAVGAPDDIDAFAAALDE